MLRMKAQAAELGRASLGGAAMTSVARSVQRFCVRGLQCNRRHDLLTFSVLAS